MRAVLLPAALAVVVAVSALAVVLGVQPVSAQPVSEEYSIADLGTLGGTFSEARGINSRGQVVGYSETIAGQFSSIRAFLWEKGEMIDLGSVSGGRSFAFDINSRGQIVGSSLTDSGEFHAVIWTK
jgi:probable HAF family extracellular repeat protein